MTFYQIMAERCEQYPVAAMAEVFDVSTSGFYDGPSCLRGLCFG